ncbi:MAG: 23S rRNA (adenine(2503)-C(2))-methyltransferase RlmN [Oscillospiraceae bacterium]|nr:23S rRNA (adenine(2503)-C(2))-methyltransferase RlmN [Oscillospiraceae bacterium]
MQDDKEMKDILSMSFEQLEAELLEMGQQKFRARQIFTWLHARNVTDFSQMSDLSLQLRNELSERFYIEDLKVVRKLTSKTDSTLKYLYELRDNNHVETVFMEYNHGNSICVSTQVGCKMGCTFCASTIAGFRRDLTASEILSQIYTAERESGRHADSIVLMGIGEPLDNFDNVVRFLQLISDERGRKQSLRHVSVSTCGIVPRIRELADMKLGITLSVSLHSANDVRRSEIMPVNRRYDIKTLLNECREYMNKTGRRISFEYAVIEGVNDSDEDARQLHRLLSGMVCHLNLIPVNPIKERDYRSNRAKVEQFAKKLSGMGLNVTVRRTLGADIDAACGQLRREYEI